MIDAEWSNNLRVELRHLRAFAAVAEERHFRRAAERLHIGQPALSRIIRALEDEVGARLFLRTTRHVELTPAGRAFLEEGRRALAAVGRAAERAREAASGDSGRLAVAYMDFAINGPLPGIIERFRRRVPGVEVTLSHLPTARQRLALAEGAADVGFLIGPFRRPGFGSVEVCREAIVALVPAGHPLERQQAVRLRQLLREPFVRGSPEAWAAYRAILDRIFLRAGLRPRVVQEASTSDGIFGLVAAKMGVTLYPACAANLRRDGVVIRPLADRVEEVATVAVWRRDATNPAVARFLETLSAAE